MRQQALVLTVLATLLVSGGAAAQLPEKVGDTPVPSLAPIVKKASPAVVNIATRGTMREQRPRNPLLEDPFFRRFFEAPDLAPRERQFQSAGSGVIVDAKNGYIITNAHVIENADEITVTLLDDRQIKAEIVGRDKPSDVAVLKVTAKNLTEMPLADSSKARGRRLRARDRQSVRAQPHGHLRNHQRARPLGQQSGVVPGLHPDRRVDQSRQLRRRARQSRGELVGVNTAIFSGSGGNIGIGFAIPSNMVQRRDERSSCSTAR